jgi:hypothetical protein
MNDTHYHVLPTRDTRFDTGMNGPYDKEGDAQDALRFWMNYYACDGIEDGDIEIFSCNDCCDNPEPTS